MKIHVPIDAYKIHHHKVYSNQTMKKQNHRKPNSTIKSIIVGRRKMPIIPGETMYVCEAFGGHTFKVLELTYSRHSPETAIIKGLILDSTGHSADFWIGKEKNFFPGDLGVPGYAYDDRPCSLFTTKAAANAHGRTYWNWLSVRDKQIAERVAIWGSRY